MSRLRRFVSAITFIGVVFHEFGHKLFCDLTGVKVHRACYYRLGNPAGYIIHERPEKFVQSLLVTVGPLITGTGFGLLFFYISKFQVAEKWQEMLFVWLGFSVAINAFPSNTDAKNLWKNTNRQVSRNLYAIVGYPFALIIWLANALHVVWFDMFYAILLYNLVLPMW